MLDYVIQVVSRIIVGYAVVQNVCYLCNFLKHLLDIQMSKTFVGYSVIQDVCYVYSFPKRLLDMQLSKTFATYTIAQKVCYICSSPKCVMDMLPKVFATFFLNVCRLCSSKRLLYMHSSPKRF